MSDPEYGGKAPAAFVAAKTMREAAARLPSRAATRAVPNSCDPVWNEVVTVEVSESEIDREKILLAVVNHDTNKLMAKAAVPLRALLVGRHYGLKLLLGGGQGGRRVHAPPHPGDGGGASFERLFDP